MSTPENPLLAAALDTFGGTITPAKLALAVMLAREACACSKCLEAPRKEFTPGIVYGLEIPIRSVACLAPEILEALLDRL
jgi:hypothetical protein